MHLRVNWWAGHKSLFEPSFLVASLVPEASQPDRNFSKIFVAESQHKHAESGAVLSQNEITIKHMQYTQQQTARRTPRIRLSWTWATRGKCVYAPFWRLLAVVPNLCVFL